MRKNSPEALARNAARAREWRRLNPDKVKASDAARAGRPDRVLEVRRRNLAQYGLTIEEYDTLLEAQGGRCAICRNLPRTKRLQVDHDHTTGRVKGLLCSRCNRALGTFEWKIEALENLATYAQSIVEDRTKWVQIQT